MSRATRLNGGVRQADAAATFAAVLMPEKFGAVVATSGTTGNMANGAAVLTDANANFPASCVGQVIVVAPTGYSSALTTTIASRQSTTQVTLAAPAPAAQSNVRYLYGPDCTAALSNLAAAAITGNRVWLSGVYLISGTGPTFTAPVRIEAAGKATSLSVMAGCGIATTSPTSIALTENAAGITMDGFGVWNLASSTPVAGSVGISVLNGTQGRKRGIVVSGFYDDIDYTTTSGRYWSVTDGTQILDPVRYGVYIHNTNPSGDEGDMTISGGNAFLCWSSRQPDAAVRWESGGGLKFYGNKINQGNSGPCWNYGLDFQVADGVTTGVIPINGNSIENFRSAAIRIGNLGPSNTGRIVKVVIVGNEIAGFSSTSRGIDITPAVQWLYGDYVINDNIIRDLGTNMEAVRVKNLDAWTCKNNRFRAPIHVRVSNGCSNYDVDNSSNGAGGTLIYSDDRDNAAWHNRPVQDARGVTGLAANSPLNLWNVDMSTGFNSACMVEVGMFGRMISGASAGPVARYKRFWITSVNGTAAVSAMIEDNNATTSTLDVQSVATSGNVLVSAFHNDTGSTFRGNLTIKVSGPLVALSEK